MDAYPPYLLGHNVPLVALSGLGTPDPNEFDEIERQYPSLQQGGPRTVSELPHVTGSKAEDLLDCFQEFDARDAAWNSRPGRGKMGSMGFTYRILGRSFTFPPHKTDWPSSLEDSGASEGSRKSTTLLHSPLSPLSPSSPIYPDGIMTNLWFVKHQLLLPATLLVFFNFTLDPNRIVLEDNKIKKEVNALKSALTNSGYKTRLGIVLVSETNEVDSNAAERVANLRRSLALDSKSLFHLPGYTSNAELRAFVGNILAALQPACIEYYRDLSKHARRKRNRGSLPLPTIMPAEGAAKALSTQGWTVRYELKLGCFAEFRQEMDAAGRSYETAYEGLLEGDIFDLLPHQSLRFNEFRMLADAIAVRIIRCLLWTNQTSSAVQSWTNHKSRMRDLVDQKGGGTRQYGWQAWEARWSSIMGEIIERVNLPIFHPPREIRSPGSAVPEIPVVLAGAEKSFGNDPRLAPWDYLHHPGYWFSHAAYNLRNRRALAQLISSEDAEAAEKSSVLGEAKEWPVHESYLCPEPYEELNTDHSALLVETLTKAADQFSAHEGVRNLERVQLEIALEHMVAERWSEAMQTLQPLWQTMSWRSSGWWDLVFQVSSAMKSCAQQLEDWETYLAAEYELLSNCLPYVEETTYDFASCLEDLKLSSQINANLDYTNLIPTYTATFTFFKQRGNAGVPELAQLQVASCAHETSTPIQLSSILLTFEGGLKEIEIRHDRESVPISTLGKKLEFYDVETTTSSSLTESTLDSSKTPPTNSIDLTFTPGTKKIILVRLLPREAGEIRASHATLKFEGKKFKFNVRIQLREQAAAPPWWAVINGMLHGQKLDLEQHCSLSVLPKPPKLRISLLSFPRTFYIDEKAEIRIQILNDETDAADIKLTVSLSGGRDVTPLLHLDRPPDDAAAASTTDFPSNDAHIALGELASGSTLDRTVYFQAIASAVDLSLVIRADYFLVSDPETPITIQLKDKVQITAPFEVTHDFVPQFMDKPWPSYFALSEDSKLGPGLHQTWRATARISSFAMETLRISDIQLEAAETKYVAGCSADAVDHPADDEHIDPAQVMQRSFRIEAWKADLDDRRSAIIGLRLRITWYRLDESSKATTTNLLVPALTVPFGEPRVLCKASPVPGDPYLINVTYRLENPSTHFLNFSVSMETSDEFAFSGAKAQLVPLVPLCRTDVKFTLVPFQHQAWIHPYLRVTDTGFGQELKVYAADGCRNEKKAIAIWVADGPEALVED